MKRLQDKVAVITGGNSGIGLAAAKRFVEEGASVAIFGRNQESLDAAVAELGDKAIGVQGDVTSRESLKRLFDTVVERFGKVDALFVNAGVAFPVPFASVDEDHYDSLFDINVKGAYFTVQQALPHFSKDASVVLTTSAFHEKGAPGLSVYSATKAALRSLARSLSAELSSQGVRVNSISPGPIETPLYGRMNLPQEVLDGMSKKILATTPAGRFGKPDEVAEAAVFLASPESSYMLGSEIAVDGGIGQL